jgi:hypothetical protein
MSKWNEADIVPGAFLRFQKGPDSGLWKIVDVRKFVEDKSKVVDASSFSGVTMAYNVNFGRPESWTRPHYTISSPDQVRITIDQNLDIAGDEKVIEWRMENVRDIYLMTPVDTFTKKNAQSWPPPLSMERDEVEFQTYDEEARTDQEHEGFEMWTVQNGQPHLINVWEYCNEKEDKFLQIVLEDEEVIVYTGYQTRVGFIDLI